MPLFGPNIKRLKKKGDIEGLIQALDNNNEAGEAAFNALVQIGEPAVSKIIDALGHSERWSRNKAIQILGKIGSDQAKEALLMLLDDDDSDIREEAVQSLGAFQDKKLTDLFVQALKDDQDWRVRNKAALALDKLSWEPISEQDKVYYGIATEVWEELELFGETAVEPLIEALDLNYVHNDAALTLGKIRSTKAISPLIRKLGKELELNFKTGLHRHQINIMYYPAMALNMIGEPAIPHLIKALSSEHIPTRAGAEMTLFSLGDRAIPSLTKALDDENEIIRESSAELLQKIKKEAD